jgi:hypothetical protein
MMGIVAIAVLICGVAIVLFEKVKSSESRRIRLLLGWSLIVTGLVVLLLLRSLTIGY